jgi:ubiquinone/menaquinone biosynthesis C-methylase UbiE
LLLCAINPVNGDPHEARQVYVTNVRNPGIACGIHHFVDFLDFLDKQEPIRTLRAEAVTRMQIAGRQRMLDVGCGVGGATFLIGDLTDPSGLAAGVDVSSALIDVAKQRAGARPGIEFRIGDACAIPYPDNYFEGARSERVFLFLPDRVAAIQEMKGVVKSGGRVCLIDTDFDSIAIYSTNRALTRKMTSIIAESIQNPNSARELPALATQALNTYKWSPLRSGVRMTSRSAP